MEGVPVAVVQRRVELDLERAAPPLQQELRPPLPELQRQEGRGRGVGAPGRGRHGARVEHESGGAADQEAE